MRGEALDEAHAVGRLGRGARRRSSTSPRQAPRSPGSRAGPDDVERVDRSRRSRQAVVRQPDGRRDLPALVYWRRPGGPADGRAEEVVSGSLRARRSQSATGDAAAARVGRATSCPYEARARTRPRSDDEDALRSIAHRDFSSPRRPAGCEARVARRRLRERRGARRAHAARGHPHAATPPALRPDELDVLRPRLVDRAAERGDRRAARRVDAHGGSPRLGNLRPAGCAHGEPRQKRPLPLNASELLENQVEAAPERWAGPPMTRTGPDPPSSTRHIHERSRVWTRSSSSVAHG